MSDSKPRLRLPAAQLRPVLPLVAALCALLALWLAWNGWQQLRDDRRAQGLEQARDAAVQGTAHALRQQLDRLGDRLGSSTLQATLGIGDIAGAAAQLKAGWPQVEQVEILPPDLDGAYAGLPRTGFGRLAAAEAALATNAPVARIVKDDGVRLVLAAPARSGDRLAGVAYVRLPLAQATQALQGAQLADDSYLALRQGNYTVLERGDKALANSAEALSAKVPGTELRIAAALPDETAGAFGLDATASFVAALVLAGLALAAWLALRRNAGAAHDVAADEPHAEPTLAQAIQQAPLPERAAPAVAVAEAAKPGPVRIDRGIFRAYDIRGIVGETLDIGVAELIGHAVGTLMFEQGLGDIVVGRDGRLSGPDLVAGLTEGLRKAGRNVIDIGLAPTPVVYFGGFHLRTGCGIAVTGSHNPPDYNGFKIVVGGTTLSGDAIVDLYARIAEDRLHTADTPGTVVERDLGEDYVARIAADVQIDRRLKVVVDAGNGVAGVLGPRVLEAIGADVTPLYCEIDGNFPNHHPDPSEPHNLADLIKMVERLDADLGIAFDGDGDRLGVVTRDGESIYPDRLLMLFAADVLDRNPGAVIVYDVKCTGRLPGHILRHGGSPLMWKTGHSLIKAKMREVEAELAGEMSGHFFFAERWYGFDDGIYAAARLLEILAAKPETPSEQLNALPNGVSTPELKVDAPDGDPHAFVERFRNAARFEGGRSSTIDGLRVDWPDGWGLVRASNTTPVLVLRFDADSQPALARIQAAFREQLLALKPDLALPF
ncbi:phosphomannomutase/phosphoglucomutase [Luteimonas sp. 50]|uniref:phosphomannomutase n=1 Tax=Cognatiluteimonas sedimenti TaxID=2927791 RepID=A0ABT0A5B9_9GAMM|nr:phosphomannomutase/phosphoglucomutase [Lysobacter sedimenti]MCJ0826167.1 phosphomannomutase/phosphoglucomutase [Lysobacter sedimenti]